MSNLKKVHLLSLLTIVSALVLLTFQNCSKQGFNVSSIDSSSVSGQGAPHGTVAQVVLDAGLLKSTQNMTFTVFANEISPSATYEWSHQLSGLDSACELKSDPKSKVYTINCAQAGDLKISVKMTDGNQSRVVTDLTDKVIDSYGGIPQAGLKVSFHIKDGTNRGPWNTPLTAVETFIGQTLTITNDDTIADASTPVKNVHRMHTNNSPCGHGADFAQGASMDCVISTAHPLKTPANTDVYDHYAGTGAAFYVIAYDGAALYMTNCTGCHQATSTSTTANKAVFPSKAAVAFIRNRMATVPEMIGNAPIHMLTNVQIEAISNYLGGFGK